MNEIQNEANELMLCSAEEIRGMASIATRLFGYGSNAANFFWNIYDRKVIQGDGSIETINGIIRDFRRNKWMPKVIESVNRWISDRNISQRMSPNIVFTNV